MAVMQKGDVLTDILSISMTCYFNLESKLGMFKQIAQVMFRYMYPVETSAEPIFRLRPATFQKRSDDGNHLPSSIFIFSPCYVQPFSSSSIGGAEIYSVSKTTL